jgi:hypothetical protein
MPDLMLESQELASANGTETPKEKRREDYSIKTMKSPTT